MQGTLTKDELVWGIILTVAQGAGLSYLLWHFDLMSLATAIGAGFAGSLAHPLVGRLSAGVIWVLCSGVDQVYGLGCSWGDWDASTMFWVAVFWPVTAPVMLLITGFGLLYGVMYVNLFRTR